MVEEGYESFDSEAHKARLGKGAVLIARDMEDPNFSSTVVLLCEFGLEGSYGLVLNRPSHMPLTEVFEEVPELELKRDQTRRIYIGGPVQPGDLQIIQIGQSVPGSIKLAEDVFLGGAWTDLDSILSHDPANIRLFLGYSGWGVGQLEEEVEAGAWEVWKVEVKKLLLAPEEFWLGGKADLDRFLPSS